MNKEIPALTGLRGVAALWVLAYHLSGLRVVLQDNTAYWLTAPLTAGGYLGVDLFFVLSGFVLARSYPASHVSVRAYGSFIWKRLARIYPVYIVVLVSLALYVFVSMRLGTDVLQARERSITSLIESALLIQAWHFPAPAVWNIAGWSLSAEWAAYLCFPVIAVLVSRIRTVPTAVAVIYTLFAVFFALNILCPTDFSFGMAMPRITVEFSSGVLLFRISSLHQENKHNSDTRALCCLLGLIIGANALDAFNNSEVAGRTLPIVACGVVYYLASAQGSLSGWLSRPLMLYLGRISFCLYLVQIPVLILIQGALYRAGFLREFFPQGVILTAILIAATCIALAAALHRFVELPAQKFLTKRRTPEHIGQPVEA